MMKTLLSDDLFAWVWHCFWLFWCCEVSITSFCLILFPPWLFQLSKLSRDSELCNYHQHLFIMTVLEHIDFFLPRKCLFKYPSRSKSPHVRAQRNTLARIVRLDPYRKITVLEIKGLIFSKFTFFPISEVQIRFCLYEMKILLGKSALAGLRLR